MSRVALVSLERWDDVWRRNQHLAAQLVEQQLVDQLTFVEPASRNPSGTAPQGLPAGIQVVRPALRLPKRAGGLREVGRTLRRTGLKDVDLLWINDPALGMHCLTPGQPALYDITDDWRTYDFPPRIQRRITVAEDRLAIRATTVVCSETLQERWLDRYDVKPLVVHNGIDANAWQNVRPRALPGSGPHVGYIGTVQSQRLDVELVMALAANPAVGTVHLVGPDALTDEARHKLAACPNVLIHGAVPAVEVPGWTVAMDVLICPHRITPFTLSLDAIKAREYLASGVPIVATPTSGFQRLDLTDDPTVTVCSVQDFTDAVTRALRERRPPADRDLSEMSWAHRAREFFAAFSTAQSSAPERAVTPQQKGQSRA